jgi:hypothetical protein
MMLDSAHQDVNAPSTERARKASWRWTWRTGGSFRALPRNVVLIGTRPHI